jgi:hypothetical protein
MEKNRFKEALLERREFIYTLELVPGRGSRGKTQDDILRIAERAAQSRLVHAVSITDDPGSRPALCPQITFWSRSSRPKIECCKKYCPFNTEMEGLLYFLSISFSLDC